MAKHIVIFLTYEAPAQYGRPLGSVYLNAGLQAGSPCASARSCDRPPWSRISIVVILRTADAQSVPKVHVSLHAYHAALPLINFKTFPTSATLPVLRKLDRSYCCFPNTALTPNAALLSSAARLTSQHTAFFTSHSCTSLNLKGEAGGRRLDWCGSEQGKAAECCEHGGEGAGSMKCGEFLEWLGNCELLKSDSALCSYLSALSFCWHFMPVTCVLIIWVYCKYWILSVTQRLQSAEMWRSIWAARLHGVTFQQMITSDATGVVKVKEVVAAENLH